MEFVHTREVILIHSNFNTSFTYNSTVRYHPYENYKDLVKGEEITTLEIVVKDDNKEHKSFKVEFEKELFSTTAYRYKRHGDPYDAGGFESSKSALNKDKRPMRLWDT